MKMMISLVFLLSMLTCFNARAVKENSLAESVRCEHGDPICIFSKGMAHLLLDPSNTYEIMKEAIADVIHSFSGKEVLEGVLGAITVPLSYLVHSPEIIRDVSRTLPRVVYDLKHALQYMEQHWRRRPLEEIKRFASVVVLVPFYTTFEALEGIGVALDERGFPHFHQIFLTVRRIGEAIFHKIDMAIRNFECTDIRSQGSCNKLFQVFEEIVVNPGFTFANGLMAIVEQIAKKEVEVVIPIVDLFQPSKVEAFCKTLLSDETCDKIKSVINEMDNFSGEEIRKVELLAAHVIYWIDVHIFHYE